MYEGDNANFRESVTQFLLNLGRFLIIPRGTFDIRFKFIRIAYSGKSIEFKLPLLKLY